LEDLKVLTLLDESSGERVPQAEEGEAFIPEPGILE
jgi:hypothetical protein